MILVIGKNGQLARAIKSLDSNVHCLGREDIDLVNSEGCLTTIAKLKPSGIINASAYTAVDLAESNKHEAFELNADAVKNIAHAAKKLGVHFVHVSTDYVFSGDKGSPYLPNDEHKPLNRYGESKAAGETLLLSSFTERTCILRTSWVYSVFGNNFVKTMIELMASKPQLQVIDDQIGSPTSAHTLAKACLAALNNCLTGVHHVTDEGVASWYDFAVAIQDIAVAKGLIETRVPIYPVSSSAFQTPAKRPTYSVLSKTSLKQALPDLTLNHWRDELEIVINQLSINKI
ncbi:dTDP-4-dehydrorhamnose reductase [Agaribacter flavus]|uniref:dTDP-4-dehydrorhamnose reductase n=1 Tax=Agaribacter flavus TaxID=1902781 RepID=A0ABV7FS27_9ALTE